MKNSDFASSEGKCTLYITAPPSRLTFHIACAPLFLKNIQHILEIQEQKKDKRVQ